MGCGSSNAREITPDQGLQRRHDTDPGSQRRDTNGTAVQRKNPQTQSLEQNSNDNKQQSFEPSHKNAQLKSKNQKDETSNQNMTAAPKEPSHKNAQLKSKNQKDETSNQNMTAAPTDDSPLPTEEGIASLPPAQPANNMRRKSRRFSTDETIKKLEKAIQHHDGDNDARMRPKTRGGGERPKTSQTRTRHRHIDTAPAGADTELIVQGKVDMECPSTAKIIRIFTSSTFTDTRHERNALMEKVYPRLKEVCHQEGFEFQVVDMRWGVRDESTDDHMGPELCLREVEFCKKLSTGPYFVTFLSHKYGYRPLPRLIPADDFHLMLSAIQSVEAIGLLQSWFVRDDNSVPPTYVLQPISSFLPDFKSSDPDLQSQAKAIWNNDSIIMQDAIVSVASVCPNKLEAKQYGMSITEAEITKGLLAADADAGARCVWFDRIIEDIEKQKPNVQLSRYRECMETDEKVQESQELLKQLRDALTQRIPKNNLIPYKIKWSENGVDPVKNPKHMQYIEKLCLDFKSNLLTMIHDAIKRRQKTDLANPLFEEILQHTLFCQEKCKAFHGRHDTLERIYNYLGSNDNIPLVVHGPSGCGKTSIVAMAAKGCWDKFHGSAAVIVRFIGTTPDSSTIGALLTSVTQQMMKIYGQEDEEMPANIKDLTEVFQDTMALATEKRPLVILLDSLDQLDPSWNARQLGWLPTVLPVNVKIIVSTLPEAQYECLPQLQAMFKNLTKTHFLDVPKLPDKDALGILDKWLEASGRKLTEEQRMKVMVAFHKCPLPLFLKLSFDEACRWTSYAPPDQTVLQDTVRGSIDALLARVEQLHGKLFVSHSLAYLTLSKSGLTDSELEDILSCDDEVLNDVYTYWTPPLRRLPPFLLVRLKAELRQYLVDRGADGVRVFYWYHRQFIEAARDRYCSDEAEMRRRHMALAEFFSGTWSSGRLKSYTDMQGHQDEANRHVTSQPLKFGVAYNMRKLNNLPYHRLEAGQTDELKQECLLNFHFIFAKLHGSGLRQVLDDFSEARKVSPGDQQLKTLTETLQLSQDALLRSPAELPSHVLGRIANPKGLETFLEDCKNSPSYYLLPNQMILTPPGGKLVHCLAGHKGDVLSIVLSPDGKVAVTSAEDKSIKFWSTAEGKLIRSVDGVGDDPDNLQFCSSGKIVLVSLDLCIQAYSISTGVLIYSIDLENAGKRLFCPCGKNNSIVGIVFEKAVKLYDAQTGALQNTIKGTSRQLGDYGPCVGSEKYMAFPDGDQFIVFVVDIEAKSFIHVVQVFPPFKNEDGDDDQYTTDAMAMTADGTQLIVTNCFDNNLNVYDIKSMKKLHEWQGNERDFSDKFHLTSNCKQLFFPNKREIVVWNLNTGSRSVILQHPVNVIDVATTDLHIVVSIGHDRVVRIWDTSREMEGDDQQGEKDQTDTSEKKPKEDIELKFVKFLDNPRYVLQQGKGEANHYIQVFDLATSKVIREAQMVIINNYTDVIASGIGSRTSEETNACQSFTPLGDKHAIVKVERKLKLLDLMSMTFIKTFQGKLSSAQNYLLINNKKDILCTTRGRKNLKVLSIDSGKAIKVLETHQKQLIDDIVVNKQETVAVVGLDEGPAVIFNLKKYEVMHTLTKEAVGLEDDLYLNDALITDNGKYLIFQGSKIPKGTDQATDEYVLFSWDLTTNKLAAEMADIEYYNKYQNAENNDLDTGVDTFVLFDDNTLLANLNDGIIRMYDIKTGVIKQRFEGHNGSTTFSIVPGSPYILTYGAWVEDNSFRLLDKTSMDRLASYSPDFNLAHVELTKDGYHVLGFTHNQSKPVVWELKGGPSKTRPAGYSELTSFPATYGDVFLDVCLTLIGENDEEDDPDDLDKEDDEEEDDDDDDDDDELETKSLELEDEDLSDFLCPTDSDDD